MPDRMRQFLPGGGQHPRAAPALLHRQIRYVRGGQQLLRYSYPPRGFRLGQQDPAGGPVSPQGLRPSQVTASTPGPFPLTCANRSRRPSGSSPASLSQTLAHLRGRHRLGFIVFQFLPWSGHKNANLNYLLYGKELMARLPIAVEFRHGSWLTRHHAGELFNFLSRHRMTYIA